MSKHQLLPRDQGYLEEGVGFSCFLKRNGSASGPASLLLIVLALVSKIVEILANYKANQGNWIIFFSCFLAAALKCFTCKGTDKSCGKRKLEGNKTFYLQTCLAGFDRCMRTWTKDKDGVTEVFSSCAKQSLCEQAKERCEDNDQKCAVGCCSNDACNASSTIVINIILFITCFGIGLTLLK